MMKKKPDQLATRILDRLIHRSRVIVINDGPSYREHAHKQEVLSNSPEGD